MSDLTKLKPCELIAHLDGRGHAEMCGTCDYSKETERRLERLEYLEARDRNWDSLYTVALERLERCEADWERESIQHAACLTAAEGWAGADPPKKGDWSWSPALQAVLDLRKRLERCEAALRGYMEYHATVVPDCPCRLCDAARAALEGK